MSNATRESNLWNWLMKAKQVFKDKLHATRVENLCGKSFPDGEGTLFGVQWFCELKCEALPANPTTKIKPRFEPGQPEWLWKRHQAGGRSYVLLQVGKGQDALRFLIRGDRARELAHGATVRELQRMALLDPKASAVEILTEMAGLADREGDGGAEENGS